MFMNCTRNSAISAGDITNEEVMTVTINHGGKIKQMYACSFTSAPAGAPANFQSTASTAIDDETCSFLIRMTSVSISDDKWTAY